MQTIDDQPYPLLVGTEVSAKYKGAFCEAKVRKVVRNIKCKVAYKQGLGSGTVGDDMIRGQIRMGATVEVKHPDRKEYVEATITKIQDISQYTVVFDDGDITTLRRTALCLKSGRHFNEMTLDELPLTNPEHFGNPVVGVGRRGRRSGRHMQDDSSEEEDDEPPVKKKVQEKEANIGKVICVEMSETKKKSSKENWFPALVVAPTAQETVKIKVKDEYLVRSFKDGRYYTVPKKEAQDFTRELAASEKNPAVISALEFLDKDQLPPHWDRDVLFGSTDGSSDTDPDYESDSSTDEPSEEKDHFVAQLYKFMDDRGTPLNKGPSITNRDVDLYRLFRTVQKLGGYNKVTTQNQWKAIAIRLGFAPATASITNLVKQAYKKFLHAFEEFNRKLGCTMITTPRNRPTKGRSLVRASSVASPKPKEENVKENVSKTTPSASTSAATSVPTTINVKQEEEEVANESGGEQKVKHSSKKLGKVRNLVDKFEEKKDLSEKEDEPRPTKEKESGKDSGNEKERKKDKPPSKKTPLPDDKRQSVRKRKDSETSLKKEPEAIAPGTSKPNANSTFKIDIGDKLKVFYHEQKVTYEAKVLEIQKQDGENVYLVHYTGWNTRYDEWVRRDRIAENLTNAKQSKKGNKSSQKPTNQGTSPAAPPPSAGNNAVGPKSAKRNRVGSKGERSTTPLPGSGKSPMTPVSRRVGTRGSSARRTSNNTDISSIQTDSDTDSDEPIKKSAQRSTSSSAASTTKAIASDKSNVTESSDEFSNGTKGRDYDLNQIRSELKGFKDLKSGSPAALESLGITSEVVIKVKNEDISNLSTKSNLSTASTSATKFSGVSSDSEEFGDGDDSQSSAKTFGSDSLKTLQTKLIAEKSSNEQKSFGKLEKSSPAPSPVAKQTEKKETKTPSKAAKAKQTDKKSEKTPAKNTDKKSSPSPQQSASSNIEKSIPRSVIEKSTAKTVLEKSKSPILELQGMKDAKKEETSDIYEFKEPEPFEFESAASSRKHLSDMETEKKTKKRTISGTSATDESPTREQSSPASSKKVKKSPMKADSTKVKDEEIASSSSFASESVESAFDALRKSPSFKPIGKMDEYDAPGSPKLINKSVFMNTNLESSPECILKSEKIGVLRGLGSVKDEQKHKISELESVKKILTDPMYEPPKVEKPCSIADKLLNVLSQKSNVESESKPEKKIGDSPLTFISKKPEMLKSSLASIAHLGDPPKIDTSHFIPIKSSSQDTKVDILESISPKNNELSETIQKLESVIQKSSAAQAASTTTQTPQNRYEEESDDSTDSEQSRLVIEDESQSSEFLQTDDLNDIKTNVIMKQDKHVNPKFLQESFQESKLIQRQYESSNLVKISDEPTTKTVEKTTTAEGETPNEPISMLLCEETIPGSPASSGIKDATDTNTRKVYADSGFLVPASLGERDDIDPNDYSGKKGTQTAENSPRGSYSQDDSKSDSERMTQDEYSGKKRTKRQRKSSETETSAKKRRGRTNAANTRNNGTDSEDNSDIAPHRSVPMQNISNTCNIAGRSLKPSQYNFLVQLAVINVSQYSAKKFKICKKLITTSNPSSPASRDVVKSYDDANEKTKRMKKQKQVVKKNAISRLWQARQTRL
ncbi:AT-rich interactive domain-containing protein 4B isoform X2 [Culicoides brevitarsis]|uniref:AT-rich interactive domain-containing protein 4B isoform X2 n=1 Tax=Culicoides brevitarsis TaxID=469753 RepID=UPI00307C70E8